MPHKTIKSEDCPHTEEMKITATEKAACEVCREIKQLRLCTSCGRVFCCESHLAHNREHFEKTGHPIIMSLPYTWIWCWKCNAYLE